MEDNLQRRDECNGVAMPVDEYDYICKDGKWVRVDVPSENAPETPDGD